MTTLPYPKVHVVINPASGQDEPILNVLNHVFHPAGITWDVSLTHKSGDATHLAAQAVASGVDLVAAYGGDGGKGGNGGKGGKGGNFKVTNADFVAAVFPLLPEGAFAAMCSKRLRPSIRSKSRKKLISLASSNR